MARSWSSVSTHRWSGADDVIHHHVVASPELWWIHQTMVCTPFCTLSRYLHLVVETPLGGSAPPGGTGAGTPYEARLASQGATPFHFCMACTWSRYSNTPPQCDIHLMRGTPGGVYPRVHPEYVPWVGTHARHSGRTSGKCTSRDSPRPRRAS